MTRSLREQAALLCSMAASYCAMEPGGGLPMFDARTIRQTLSWKAMERACALRRLGDGGEYRPLWLQEVWAEAEAMLRTGEV